MGDRESLGSSVSGMALLERERELAGLGDAVERAAGGDARVMLIEGDPGLGKTSLIEWAAERAEEHGFGVLRARGGSLERTLGWGVARQLFETLTARATPSSRRSMLRGSAALAGPVLGLGDDTSDAEILDGAVPPVKDFRLEHGLFWLVCNLCERAPLALLIDDVQWCDRATLEWLLYLVRRCERLPLLVVIAARSGEPDAPVALLELIAAEPVSRKATLSALGLAATESLLERAYEAPVDREFVLACHDWTGGNPLFVTHLAAELAAEGIDPVAASAPRVRTLTPESVTRVILLRLAHVSEAGVELARAVAVLESAAEHRYAFELADLTDDHATSALDELVAARVLGAERPLRFSHPLIGGVVYDDIPAARRATMHKRAAQLLLTAGADLGRAAAHLLRSTPAGDHWVVAVLRGAAVRELSQGSPSTAAQLLRRAGAEPPGPDELEDVLLALGRSELLAGDPAGVATLRSALAASTDVAARGQIALLLGSSLTGNGHGREAIEIAAGVADEVGWRDTDLRLRLEALIVNAARSDASLLPLIAEHLRDVRRHADDDTYGGRLISAELSWGLTAIGAPAERAIQYARRALAGGRLIAEAPETPHAYLGAIHMLTLNDQLVEADQLFATAISLAQQNGSAPAFAANSCFRAHAVYLRGRLKEAELLTRDALRISAESRALALIERLATAYLAVVLTKIGRLEEADALLGEAPQGLEQAPDTWATELMFARGCLALASGNPDRAAEWLLGCGRRAVAWGVVNPAWIPWRSEAGLVLHQLGEVSRARELCDEELELARRCGARRPLGIALRARGVLDGGPAGIELLREAEGVLESSPARLEYARALIAHGAALRRANSRAEARAKLADGLAIAEHSGAGPLATEARTELMATGARPRGEYRTGADSLTPSERRVCELAASGKSNPEIAQLLFVTRATVESHLHSAYRRLDITSRNELAEALADGDR